MSGLRLVWTIPGNTGPPPYSNLWYHLGLCRLCLGGFTRLHTVDVMLLGVSPPLLPPFYISHLSEHIVMTPSKSSLCQRCRTGRHVLECQDGRIACMMDLLSAPHRQRLAGDGRRSWTDLRRKDNLSGKYFKMSSQVSFLSMVSHVVHAPRAPICTALACLLLSSVPLTSDCITAHFAFWAARLQRSVLII